MSIQKEQSYSTSLCYLTPVAVANCECHQFLELIHAGVLQSYVEVRTSVIFPSLFNKTLLATLAQELALSGLGAVDEVYVALSGY